MGETWVGLSPSELPAETARTWATRPDCGAVVLFVGTARDHSEGRDGVHRLVYEAYDKHVVPRLVALDSELRSRWPSVRRTALLHRTGEVPIGEAAVVVVVSSPHRAEAFEGARFAIDALKSTVPIWKREAWIDGESWGREAQHLADIESFGTAPT